MLPVVHGNCSIALFTPTLVRENCSMVKNRVSSVQGNCSMLSRSYKLNASRLQISNDRDHVIIIAIDFEYRFSWHIVIKHEQK